MLNTTAAWIIMADGAAAGVKAGSAEHEYAINAKAAIPASGGF